MKGTVYLITWKIVTQIAIRNSVSLTWHKSAGCWFVVVCIAKAQQLRHVDRSWSLVKYSVSTTRIQMEQKHNVWHQTRWCFCSYKCNVLSSPRIAFQMNSEKIQQTQFKHWIWTLPTLYTETKSGSSLAKDCTNKEHRGNSWYLHLSVFSSCNKAPTLPPIIAFL